MKHLSSISFFLFLLALSCSSEAPKQVDLLLHNATVVDVANNTTITHQFVAISGQRIVAVNDMRYANAFRAEKVVDVSAQYVMPGLWDNHVHFRGGKELIAENKELLALYVQFGVTTVRDAGGDMTPSVLQWKKQIESGELVGPYIFTSGPKLDGPRPAWAGSIKIEKEEDIALALDSLEAIGADYVKMYDGSLSVENFYAIIAAAEERGMKTTGHMPMSGDLKKALALGLDGSEHMYYVMKACSPKADSLTDLNLGYGMMETLTETYDPQMAADFFAELAEREVYITPTMYIQQVLGNLTEVSHATDSLLPRIGEGIQKTYEGRVRSAQRAKASGSQMREKVTALTAQMIPEMLAAGVPILAGSDGGPSNSFVYPGEALWGELFSLNATGLSPAEVLRTSLINGPAFFGKQADYGSVAEGKMADLLILEKNPLDDLQHLRSLKQVLLKGKTR